MDVHTVKSIVRLMKRLEEDLRAQDRPELLASMLSVAVPEMLSASPQPIQSSFCVAACQRAQTDVQEEGGTVVAAVLWGARSQLSTLLSVLGTIYKLNLQ